MSEGTPTKILFPNPNNRPNQEAEQPKKPVKKKSDFGARLSAFWGSLKTRLGKGSFWKKLFLFAGIMALLGAIALFVFIMMVRGGSFGELPTRDELKAIKNPQGSQIYSIDGQLLGRIYDENRTNVKYENISANVIQALVATEDARFFQHKGFDLQAYIRVIIKTILLQDSSSGGGSTIGQQLIKNLYKREGQSIPVFKMKEAIIAKRLDDVYTKEEILALYLNTVSFGERAFGIGTASQRFFSKQPKDLDVHEAATLIGMLKAPTYYSPRRNPKRALGRRNVVMDLMVKQGYLTATKASNYKEKPLELQYRRESFSEGPAPHFRDRLKDDLKKWGEDHRKPNGDRYNVFTDGLKIYTTIDSRMQQYAEEAVRGHMTKLQKDFNEHWKGSKSDKFWKSYHPWEGSDKEVVERAQKNSPRYRNMKAKGVSEADIMRSFRTPKKMRVFSFDGDDNQELEITMSPNDSLRYYLYFLNTGMMALDPHKGEVRAWVGSVDHRYFKYDHTQSKRQVGSTFKPLVYATALETGASRPCNFYPNELRTYTDEYGKQWTPGNSDGVYGGYMSMRGAMMTSTNTVSVQIMFEATVDSVLHYAKKVGIKSELPAVPSITLGTADISVQEMVCAYASFVNGGYGIQEPTYLLRIEDASGKVLDQFESPEIEDREKVWSQETTEKMCKMLEAVVDSGTARRINFVYGLDQAIGGKTGTTQDNTDGWFMGITPNLVVGAWAGGADRRVRFRDIRYGQGANMALPSCGDFLRKLYKDPAFKKMSRDTFAISNDTTAYELGCTHHSGTYIYKPPLKPFEEEPEIVEPVNPRKKDRNVFNPVNPKDKDRRVEVKPKNGGGSNKGDQTKGDQSRSDRIKVRPKGNTRPKVTPKPKEEQPKKRRLRDLFKKRD